MTATNRSSPDLATMLERASVEVSSRDRGLAELTNRFSPGIDVTVTFLPGYDYRHNVETAAAVRRLGFNPVPHIAAREMQSREAGVHQGQEARWQTTALEGPVLNQEFKQCLSCPSNRDRPEN